MSDTAMQAKTEVARLTEFRGSDLHDLIDAADAAIRDGGGFGWVTPPRREVAERFWRGVLVVPGRDLFVARLDGTVAGSAQLVRPPKNNEAQSHAATVMSHFVAPWARGHGLARMVVEAIEETARAEGFAVLNMDVRETQTRAIQVYEHLGFKRWGVHPYYARVAGKTIAGYHYMKLLAPFEASQEDTMSPTGEAAR